MRAGTDHPQVQAMAMDEARVLDALKRGPLTALDLCEMALPMRSLRTVNSVLRLLQRSGRVASVRGRRAYLRMWHLVDPRGPAAS